MIQLLRVAVASAENGKVLKQRCVTVPVQAQQLASVHAQQAAQAREELEEVRRAAADSIRSSSVTTEQLRELEHLRDRVAAADQERARWAAGSSAGSGV